MKWLAGYIENFDAGVYSSELAAGGVNIKEEYSDPSDYSSDTCSDLDWTSRSAAANGANSASVTHGINCTLFYPVLGSMIFDRVICSRKCLCLPPCMYKKWLYIFVLCEMLITVSTSKLQSFISSVIAAVYLSFSTFQPLILHKHFPVLHFLSTVRITLAYRHVILLALSLTFPSSTFRRCSPRNRQKLPSSTTPLLFDAPPRGTPANIRIGLMFPETRVIGLHFCRW